MLIPLSARTERHPRRGHLFPTELGWHVLVAEGSRLYRVNDDFREAWQEAADEQQRERLLAEAGLDPAPEITAPASDLASVRALSLAEGQKGNLRRRYCCAEHGAVW